MSTARVLARNTAVQVAGKVVSTVLGVITVGLMTRHLGQEGFGMYSTANAFFQFFGIMLDLGLNVMIVQLLGERSGDTAYENRVSSAVFTLRTITAFILLGAAPFIGLLFPYPWELKLALFAIWGSFFVTALNQIVVGVQQRHLKMHAVAIGEVVGRIVLLSGVILARQYGWGLVPIVLWVSIGSTANFFINFFIARRYAALYWNMDVALWKTILKRSWPIGVSILFNLLYFKADTIILSLYRPQAEVGIYGAAYRVLEILVTVPFMYAGVLLPLIASAWANGRRQDYAHLLSRSYDAMVFIAAPLVAGTFILATPGMVLVAGSDFAVSGDVLRILVLAIATIFFGTVSSYAIVALGAQRRMLPVYIVVALLTLGAYFLLIPRFGMWAAAWLTVVSEFCVAAASTYLSLRISCTSWNPTQALKMLAAAMVMAAIIYPLRDKPLLLPVILGGTVYILLALGSGAVKISTLKEIVMRKK